MRQQHVRDVGVVLQQVALGQAELRPEHLAEVGQTDLAAVDGQDDIVVVAGSDGRLGMCARWPRRMQTQEFNADPQ